MGISSTRRFCIRMRYIVNRKHFYQLKNFVLRIDMLYFMAVPFYADRGEYLCALIRGMFE